MCQFKQIEFFAVLLFLLTGCVSTPAPTATVPESGSTEQSGSDDVYRIQDADELEISFFYNPQLNKTVRVRPDGRITLQLVDDVLVTGLTPMEVDALLTKEYGKELKDPEISVIVASYTNYQVYVGGEVEKPQAVDISDNLTPVEAVLKAGGFKETAKLEHTIIIRRGQDDKPVSYAVNLEEMLYGGGRGFKLQPDDVVYVPKTKIAEANKFVQQYISDLILFRGMSLNYDLNDDN